MTTPQKFDNIQDYLTAEGFVINGDFFVKGTVKFPVIEVSNGYTVHTFAQKARARGWIRGEKEEPPTAKKFGDIVTPLCGVSIFSRAGEVFDLKNGMKARDEEAERLAHAALSAEVKMLFSDEGIGKEEPPVESWDAYWDSVSLIEKNAVGKKESRHLFDGLGSLFFNVDLTPLLEGLDKIERETREHHD